MVSHMDRHTTTTMVGVRVTWEMKAHLEKMAKDRGTSVNAMLLRMISRRIEEIREEEGW